MVPMPGSSSVVSFAVVIDLGGGRDPLRVGVRAEAVVEAAAGQPVAVGDLDGVHPGGVQRGGDGRDAADGEAVADGVHAVAQGHVLDVDRLVIGAATCRAAACGRGVSAMRSAAEVMMSRLPA